MFHSNKKKDLPFNNFDLSPNQKPQTLTPNHTRFSQKNTLTTSSSRSKAIELSPIELR
jgi:hypothetical protein